MRIKARINPKDTLGKLKATDIYSEQSNGIVFSPFNINIDPMEHLILINFEKDPDRLYKVLEFQQARNESGKKRFLVIAYRNDGAADVYYQSGFPFASQSSILNDASFIERSLENAKFEVNADSLDVDFCFDDKLNRPIKVKVNECKRRKKKPFFLLAPVGELSKNPTSLPVYSLYEMSFTRKKFTEIEIEFDKVKHNPDSFPIPIDCSRNYFTRYSVDTFNVDWNKSYNGPLSQLKPGKNYQIEDKGIGYEFEYNSGHYEIKQLSSKNSKHKINVGFSPAFPDIACLRDGINIIGNFSIRSDNSRGVIRGYYQLIRMGNEIDLKIQPDCGWEPNESRWVLKLLFFFVKVFKEWPKSYIWNARIKFDDTRQPEIQSRWERI